MKERLDVLMTGRGLAESREKAKALIMAGLVYVDGQREDKAGQNFPSEVTIEVRGNRLPFRSPVKFAWMSAHRPAVSRTACCSKAP